MNNNLYALCFESEESNTEKRFFDYMGNAADTFGWNKIYFSSHNINLKRLNKNNIAQFLNKKFRDTTNVGRVIVFYDRDLPNDILHKRISPLKATIDAFLIDTFENYEVDICWIEIPYLESFEYLIRMFFDKPISNDQLKKELGLDYKSGECKKIGKLFTEKGISILKKNLLKYRTSTNWIKIFNSDK